MKIATFNINNVNKRLRNLLEWLEAAKPDVVCLQELKAADAEFPKVEIEKAGYGAVWRGERSWNGVAILARDCEPIVTHGQLPGDLADRQSRYIEAAVNGVLIASLYAPNGNPQPGPKFSYKLDWMARLVSHAAELYAADIPARACRRLQRRPDRFRYLPDDVLRQECPGPARRPRAVSKATSARLDGCHSRAASRCADVQFLGLHAESVAARCRTSDRSFAPEQRCREAPDEGGSGPRSAREGGC
jgi:hypothetical protein